MVSASISRWLPSGEQFVLPKDYFVSELRAQISRCEILYSSTQAVAPRLKVCFDYLTSMTMQVVKLLAMMVALPHVLTTPVLQPTPPMGESMSAILKSSF